MEKARSVFGKDTSLLPFCLYLVSDAPSSTAVPLMTITQQPIIMMLVICSIFIDSVMVLLDIIEPSGVECFYTQEWQSHMLRHVCSTAGRQVAPMSMAHGVAYFLPFFEEFSASVDVPRGG